jgi:hypothetical protein
LRTAEDHALLAAAIRAGCVVAQASDIAVETSGRRLARAPRGFGHLLRTLADQRGSGGNTTSDAVRPLTLERLAGSRAGEVCADRLRVGGQPGHHNPGSHLIANRDVDPVLRQMVRTVNESGQAAVPVTVHGTTLTGTSSPSLGTSASWSRRIP